MNFKQHLTAGVAIGIASAIPIEMSMSDGFSFVGACMLGAVLPDADTVFPLAGKNSDWIRKVFSHRGITHTPLFAIVLSIFLYLISGHVYTATGFLLGNFCHIFMDSFTVHGTMLLWPYPKYIHFTTVTCGSPSCAIISFALTTICVILTVTIFTKVPICYMSTMEYIYNLIGG